MTHPLHDDQTEEQDHTQLLRLDVVFANRSQNRISEGWNLLQLAEDEPCRYRNRVGGYNPNISHMDNVDCPYCSKGIMHHLSGCDEWYCGECFNRRTTDQLVDMGVLSKCSKCGEHVRMRAASQFMPDAKGDRT